MGKVEVIKIFNNQERKKMKKVKIISGEYNGMVVDGHRFYLDNLHTGSSSDLFEIYPNGERKVITSDKIDVVHYETQLLEDELKRLGANVGDVVIITRSGSGSYQKGWNVNETHIITKITPSGYVEFDNGLAKMFRPDVKIVS